MKIYHTYQAADSSGGPGVGTLGSGAGHGGQGGFGSRNTGGGMFYGSVTHPEVPGSSGQYKDLIIDIDRKGGGVIKIEVNLATVDGKETLSHFFFVIKNISRF